MKKILLVAMTLLFFVSCSTRTKFNVPKGHDLVVDDQQITALDSKDYVRSPMFWSNASGIPYRLEKNGKTVESGKLKAKFRVASIFWPPFAIIYWPMGFDKRGYDFTGKDSKVRVETK